MEPIRLKIPPTYIDIHILLDSKTGNDFLNQENWNDVSVDDMLEWRSQLKRLIKIGKHPSEWYEREIKATDEILKYLTREK